LNTLLLVSTALPAQTYVYLVLATACTSTQSCYDVLLSQLQPQDKTCSSNPSSQNTRKCIWNI